MMKYQGYTYRQTNNTKPLGILERFLLGSIQAAHMEHLDAFATFDILLVTGKRLAVAADKTELFSFRFTNAHVAVPVSVRYAFYDRLEAVCMIAMVAVVTQQ
jgi:hypothetical protein